MIPKKNLSICVECGFLQCNPDLILGIRLTDFAVFVLFFIPWSLDYLVIVFFSNCPNIRKPKNRRLS